LTLTSGDSIVNDIYKVTHEEFFFRVLDMLDKEGIKYWLMCGTLLSAMREGHFLPQDHKDTDIAIDSNDYWKVRRLFDKAHIEGEMLNPFIRRRELTIVSLCNRFKVDVFAMEKSGEEYNLFTYKHRPESNVWDKEWKVSYPYELFYPLASMNFMGRQVSIPDDAQGVLEVHYGKEWKIPNSDWDSYNPPHKDHSYKEIAPAGFWKHRLPEYNDKAELGFICVNFLRKECTKVTVTSLKKQYPNCNIYIADQDAPSAEMVEFYENNGVEYYYLPHDCGLSYCRNFLIERVKEPFIMWGDNDFDFDENNNIQNAIDLLKEHKDIGVVGGSVLKDNVLQHYERLLFYDADHGVLVYVPLELTEPKEYLFNDNKFYYCDLTFNIAIAKRKVFDNKKVRWNPNLKVKYEHTDFFLRLKLYGKLKTVYYPCLTVHHVHENPPDYLGFRFRKKDGVEFSNDWKLRMNFTVGKGREIYGEEPIIVEKTIIEKPIIEKPIKAIIAPNVTPVPRKAREYNYKANEALQIVTALLFNLGIGCCLLGRTCLEIVVNKEVKTNTLYLGAYLSDKNKKDLVDKGLVMIDDTDFLYNDITISFIKQKPKGMKKIVIGNDMYNLPMPVVEYLQNQFGSEWSKQC